MGQWTPVDSPTCPMVLWDRTDSGIWGPSGGTVDSHGQSHLSHGTVGSHRILMADLDITLTKRRLFRSTQLSVLRYKHML